MRSASAAEPAQALPGCRVLNFQCICNTNTRSWLNHYSVQVYEIQADKLRLSYREYVWSRLKKEDGRLCAECMTNTANLTSALKIQRSLRGFQLRSSNYWRDSGSNSEIRALILHNLHLRWTAQINLFQWSMFQLLRNTLPYPIQEAT